VQCEVLRDEVAFADEVVLLDRDRRRAPSIALAGTGAVKPDESEPAAAELRAALIAAAADPTASTVDDPTALAELAIWQRPYAFGDPATAPERAIACWQEAALLGVTGAGAVTDVGRALLDGADDVTGVLGDVGTTQRTVRVQADLTAVVAGSPHADLTALLDLAANAESRGVARTWRFSPASVRRALDAGHTADSLLDALTKAAAGELPQPLRYLIADVVRRHGSVRATAVACCLRSDDATLLGEIAADRRLRTLGLRPLAPTVPSTTSNSPAAPCSPGAGYAMTNAGSTSNGSSRSNQPHQRDPPATIRSRLTTSSCPTDMHPRRPVFPIFVT